MNKKQAANCLTLADLLGNSMKNDHWDFRECATCAIGYAQVNPDLFGGRIDAFGSFGHTVHSVFGDKVQYILMGGNIKEENLRKVTKESIRRKILKAVDVAGWEEA